MKKITLALGSGGTKGFAHIGVIQQLEKYGYTPYIIKDVGRFNTKFVEQEFEVFRFMQIDY